MKTNTTSPFISMGVLTLFIVPVVISGCSIDTRSSVDSSQQAQEANRQGQASTAVCEIKLTAPHATKIVKLDENGNALWMKRSTTEGQGSTYSEYTERTITYGDDMRRRHIDETDGKTTTGYDFSYETAADGQSFSETIEPTQGNPYWKKVNKYIIKSDVSDPGVPHLRYIRSQQLCGAQANDCLKVEWLEQDRPTIYPDMVSLQDADGLALVTLEYGPEVRQYGDIYVTNKFKGHVTFTETVEASGYPHYSGKISTWTANRPAVGFSDRPDSNPSIEITATALSDTTHPIACYILYKYSLDFEGCIGINPNQPYNICLFPVLPQSNFTSEQNARLKFTPTRF